MKTMRELVDALNERTELSDRKLGPIFGLGEGAVTHWRSGRSFPSDATARRIAEILKLDAAHVAAIINAERAKRDGDDESRKMWERVRNAFAIALVTTTASILPAPTPAHAQAPSNPCVLCQMTPCRCRRPVRQLGRAFGAVLQA